MGDLRTTKTLRALKNAFLALLEQKRFEEITVQQLCTEAEIRRATFYTHFADKYEFLAFFIQEMRDEFSANIAAFDQEESTEAKDLYFDRMFQQLIRFFEQHPQLVKNIKRSQMLSSMMEIFAQEVQKSVYSHMEVQHPAGQINEMKAAFYTGGIMRLLMLWIEKPEEFQICETGWFGMLFRDFRCSGNEVKKQKNMLTTCVER